MAGDTYRKIPESIINAPDDLGPYAAYLEGEAALTTFGNRPLERADSMQEIRQVVSGPQLTTAVREKIKMSIARGAYPEQAAASAGIPTKVWYQWMGFAAQGLEPWQGFLFELIEEEANVEIRLQEQLAQDPSGIKFLLERRFSRSSLAEDPTKRGPRWRKQSNVELAMAASDDEDNFEMLKPAQRAAKLARIDEAMRQAALAEASDLGPEIPGEEGI